MNKRSISACGRCVVLDFVRGSAWRCRGAVPLRDHRGFFGRSALCVVFAGVSAAFVGCSSGGAGGVLGDGAAWMRLEGLAPVGSLHDLVDRGDGPRMRSRYVVLGGGGLDPSRGMEVYLEPRSAGAWDVERRLVGVEEDARAAGNGGGGGGGEVDRRESWRIAGDGSAGIVESINRGEKVEVVFEPMLVVLPVGLSAGSPSEQSLRMTVHPLGDRSRVRAAGSATQNVELLGATTVPTSMGDAPAVVLRTLLEASLGPSRVRNETWTWVASREGAWGSVGVVLAERRVERTTALGIPIRSSDETWVLASAAEVIDGSQAADDAAAERAGLAGDETENARGTGKFGGGVRRVR